MNGFDILSNSEDGGAKKYEACCVLIHCIFKEKLKEKVIKIKTFLLFSFYLKLFFNLS